MIVNVCVVCCIILCFFFFKQKTAYEVRISDWSSDVCSSDLDDLVEQHEGDGVEEAELAGEADEAARRVQRAALVLEACEHLEAVDVHRAQPHEGLEHRAEAALGDRPPHQLLRSEEHTSELQSLMRTSYAVFCLKKKKH